MDVDALAEHLGVGDGVDHADVVARRDAGAGKRLGDGGRADDPQFGRWQMRLHEDLQRAS